MTFQQAVLLAGGAGSHLFPLNSSGPPPTRADVGPVQESGDTRLADLECRSPEGAIASCKRGSDQLSLEDSGGGWYPRSDCSKSSCFKVLLECAQCRPVAELGKGFSKLTRNLAGLLGRARCCKSALVGTKTLFRTAASAGESRNTHIYIASKIMQVEGMQ